MHRDGKMGEESDEMGVTRGLGGVGGGGVGGGGGGGRGGGEGDNFRV